MDKQSRTLLRNELFEEFINNKIIIQNKYKSKIYYQFKNDKLKNILNINISLKEKYNSYINEFDSEIEAKYCILNKDDYENHKCKICRKKCLFYVNKKGYLYNDTCGNIECKEKIANSKEAKEKSKQTWIENLGVDHPSKSKTIIEKSKKTKKIKYNDENYNNRVKSEKTCLEKYGTKYPIQNNEIKNKIKQKSIDHYGVENVSQSKEIKEKKKETYINHYGVNHPCKSKK